jgi:uncharacterized repeat protein (TIGR01451 family)
MARSRQLLQLARLLVVGSLIVMLNGIGQPAAPAAFAATIDATKTVSGNFQVGGSVTYPVVLSNGGRGPQPDNPGDEFVDVLPSALQLVSASATSGTAVATIVTNTVTWNGSIPAGGSVTITITATISPGTGGQ